MNKFIFAILVVCFFESSIFAYTFDNPLPNWIDTTREHADWMPPLKYTNFLNPPGDFRIPAEYEPTYAVLVGWRGYPDILAEVARIVTNEGRAEIWAAGNFPASIPNVNPAEYQKIPCNLDTLWMRDYGPFGISASTGAIGIVDTIYRHFQYRRNDDAFPSCLGVQKSIPAFSMGLILDGGNFMIDSMGNLFMTVRTYEWNANMSVEQVNSLLKMYFNVRNIYVLGYAGAQNDPADGTGHIDMFAKLLNDNTVLVSTSNEEPFKANGEKAIAFFKNIIAPNGLPYNIFTVRGIYSGGTWYTYTNSLIVNGAVIIPKYGSEVYENNLAKHTYERAMPGYTIKQIESAAIIRLGGSVHCVTQKIPGVHN